MNKTETASGAASLREDIGHRWRAADPLLPRPQALPDGCGTRLEVTGPGGRLAAAAACEHWRGEPRSLDRTWGAAERFELTVRVSTASMPGALDELLTRWRAHLDGTPAAGRADCAAVVTWPSRDVAGVQVLMARGLVPMAVIAARRTPPGGALPPEVPAIEGDPAAGPGVTVRRAGPADLADAVRLGLEVIRYDARVCSVTMRPETPAALERELAGMLADASPWVWIAERAGQAIGMLAAEKPRQAEWIAARTGLRPVAYLLLMGTAAGQRGTGVGAAMAARVHHQVQTAGVAVTLLHHAVANPLSAPFWYRQGYRPLWTVWEAGPASGFR